MRYNAVLAMLCSWLCYAMPCYAVLCYAILGYAMLCYVAVQLTAIEYTRRVAALLIADTACTHGDRRRRGRCSARSARCESRGTMRDRTFRIWHLPNTES
jgi:hypothetical protein